MMGKSRSWLSLGFVLVIFLSACTALESESVEDLGNNDNVDIYLSGAGSRKLLASCSILGKSFKACYNVNGGVVGYSLSGSTLSVGFKGGNPSGWAGWSVGNPHQGSSAVMNIQGSTTTKTMNGKTQGQITSPSRVKFGSVKGGSDQGALAATFTMKWPAGGSGIKVSFANGPGNMIQHNGKPRTYILTKGLKQV